jgi:sigma-B regulation protein RsbU (phosphoserine phosphatase)
MPLGLMPEAVYTGAETSLEVGHSLVLYTDGITEAANPEQEEFGRVRLIDACRAHHAESPEELASSIHSAVEEFVKGVPYHDDRTLVILRRTG